MFVYVLVSLTSMAAADFVLKIFLHLFAASALTCSSLLLMVSTV